MQDSDNQQIETLIKTGFSYHKQGKIEDAEPLYLEALKLSPDNAEANNLMGVISLQKNETDTAIKYVSKAISISQSEYFYETLFQAYIRKEMYENIIEYKNTILNLYPKSFPLLFDLAFAYKGIKKHKEALEYYEKALQINPESYEGWFNLANIYNIEARTTDAVSAMNICHELRPKDDSTDYLLGIYYFRTKNYTKGLPLFEKRLSKKIAFGTQNKTYPDIIREDNFWKGENIKNKNILVYYEAGYGDTIMYSRYLPLIAQKCKKLTFLCHKPLGKLFEQNKKHLGIDELVDSYTPDKILDIDLHVPLLSLPYLLKLKDNNIFITPDGYIMPDMNMVNKYHTKFFNNDKIKVGIKWQGNTTIGKNRVIPAEMFQQLINLDNAQYYSLQTFEGAENISNLSNIINIGEELTDFSQTAAILRNLDLVICNDTSLAHLAGAMHVPCWIMLPYETNWRWHTDLSKCDWYESVKLFRQKTMDDWQSVFEQIMLEMEISK